MVKRRRLELPRRNWHYPLKVARLPIPPPLQHKSILTKRVPRTGLEPARLAAHAPETCASTNSATWAFYHQDDCLNALFCSTCWAENGTRTRDPNLGKVVLYQLSYFRIFIPRRGASLSIADAKVLLFSEPPKLFAFFFQKIYHTHTFSATGISYTLLIYSG